MIRLIPLMLLTLMLAFPAGAFDLQGHRGARGLLPENTLPAFARALDIGVTTLELDVGVTRDGVPVIAHDPRLNPAIARGADGQWITAPGPAIHDLTADQVAAYDVGRVDPGHRYAKRLADQTPVDGTPIPRLADLFALVRERGDTAVRFNIETKLSPDHPDETLPPDAFADTLVAAVRRAGLAGRVTIQSFDWRTLARVNAVAPEIPTVCLTAQQRWLDNVRVGQPGPSPWTAGLDVDDHGGSVPALVKAAGCAVWSPFHNDLDADALARAHGLGLTVVVWTVNDPARMDALITLGVDGIISDRPDRLRRVAADRGLIRP